MVIYEREDGDILTKTQQTGGRPSQVLVS